ncbi:hypothetical protein IGI04_004287 [Brassica rapa subsp. trilocularis]|uniref:Uncharacterized protein n=1 Tax=Brassica rapa subsp. trilocularis TaxID=1813537 RepID=A0ABQ7NBB5_BRACM|nr:hypothetical protein IGI04_004287 [Brassica rapa subsp. trilocularis]
MSFLALIHRLAASTKLQDVTSKLDYLQHLLATKLTCQTKELGMMNQIHRAWKRKEQLLTPPSVILADHSFRQIGSAVVNTHQVKVIQ